MGNGVCVTEVTSPALFTGTETDPLQVVRVRARRTRPVGPLTVTVEGPQVRTPRPRLLRADSVEAYAGVDAAAELAPGNDPQAPEDVVEVSVAVEGAAHELAEDVRESALAALTAQTDTRGPGGTAVIVFNPLSWTRTDVARVSVYLGALGVDDPTLLAVRDEEGRTAPVLVEAVGGVGADGGGSAAGAVGVHARVQVVFLASDVPPLGHRTWWLVADDAARPGVGGPPRTPTPRTRPSGSRPTRSAAAASAASPTCAPDANCSPARVRKTLLSPVHGEVLAVSPYGSWRTVTPRAAVTVPPEGEAETVFHVHPPADTPAGVYWMLLKAVCQGRVAYGPAVAVHVRARDPHDAPRTDRPA